MLWRKKYISTNKKNKKSHNKEGTKIIQDYSFFYTP